MAWLLNVYPGDLVIGTGLIVLVTVSLIAGGALAAAGLLRRRPAAAHSVLFWALVWLLITPLAAIGSASTGFELFSIRAPVAAFVSTLETIVERPAPSAADAIGRSAANLDGPQSRLEGAARPLMLMTGSTANTSDSIAETTDLAALDGLRLPNEKDMSSGLSRLRAAAAGLLALWIFGTLLIVGRTIQSYSRMRAIRASLVPFDARSCGDLPELMRRRLKAARLPAIACSDHVSTPCVIGLFRAVIVLPNKGMTDASPGQVCDVLVHEWAHVARRDCVVLLLQRLAAGLFWPSPLMLLFNRRLTRVREEVCDNYVLAGTEAVSYGETLLRFAQLARGARPMAASVGILNWRGPLEKRIAALIDERRSTQTRAGRGATIVGLVVFGSLCLIACGTGLSSEPKPQSPQDLTQEERTRIVGVDLGGGEEWVAPRPRAARAERSDATKLDTAAVELVIGQPQTLFVPERVRVALGIRRDGKDQVAVATKPWQMPPLLMPGSTALDPSSVVRVRAFPSSRSGDKVIEIGKAIVGVPFGNGKGLRHEREIRAGDRVAKGQMLIALYSTEVANAEHDLIDAAAQLRLDEEIAKGTEAKREQVPEVFRLNSVRNVQADKNAIHRATSNLRAWGVAQKEIDAAIEEGEKVPKRGGKHDPAKEAQLGRVEIRSPIDGTVIERNVAVDEVIVDNTINLFQIAKLDKLLVIANVPEDKLPALEALGPIKQWTIKTTNGATFPGLISDIGSVVDRNQHTVLAKGDVENKQGRMRGGQFVTATIVLPVPPDVVEVPISCVVEDANGAFVFVQKDPAKANYTMQRVEIVERFKVRLFLRALGLTKGSAPNRNVDADPRTRPSLEPGTQFLQSGVGELKTVLEDRETKARGKSKYGSAR